MAFAMFANDSFYYEFVINPSANQARVTKRAFQNVQDFYDQSTTLTIAKARELFAQLKKGERQ